MSDDPYLDAYLAVVERVGGLCRGAARSDLDAPVPACPEWSVRDVIAHLSGLAEDWVDGRLDAYGTEAWTAEQIARFDGVGIGDVMERWSTAVARFDRLGPSPLGATPARWAFGDAAAHEADIRAVLSPGTRLPSAALGLAAAGAVGRWRQELTEAGVAPLEVVAIDLRTWRVGDRDAEAPTVTTSAHDLWRGLFGRRTRHQVERWDWSTDSAPYLDVGLPFPFRWADVPLED